MDPSPCGDLWPEVGTNPFGRWGKRVKKSWAGTWGAAGAWRELSNGRALKKEEE